LKTIDPAPPRRSDDDYLRLALALAGRGLGNVWPNPSVGCVLVRDGLIVGRGWTQPGGRPHGEAQALAQAGTAAKGATAFVTLEPCAHHGQTPPCAQALIDAGVTRVVIAAPDPDPRVDGRGADMLSKAGVTVAWSEQTVRRQAVELNAGFLSRMTKRRPLVTLKLATTLDGRIATAQGESQWITGAKARARGHLLRAQHDGILVGIGTALADNPELTCRLPGLLDRSPVRIVLDSRLRLAANSRLAQAAVRHPLWLITGPENYDEELENLGAVILPARLGGDGRVALSSALEALADRGLTRLLVDGGSAVATAFLAAGLVDRLAWFRAGGVMGGDGLPVFGPLGLAALAEMSRFARQGIEVLGDDVLESYLHRG
jgi:diaminohydroxyphosphoribosylaminopyrimidine deaminase/5-amino-6-(5-phosphoribosylamino)uracil reductase